MANILKDLTGKRFGRLTVIKRANEVGTKPTWECVCDCGKTKIIRGVCLTRKTRPARSCGCYMIERTKEANTKHGFKGTSEYSSWNSMRDRCLNKDSKDYHRYGARGITVCDRWNSFESFIEDMGLKPFKGASIDRIDNEKGYSLENCRWADAKTQANNKRNNRILEFNGKSMTIAQWEREVGVKKGVIQRRINNGWPIDEAITSPSGTKRKNKC